MNRLIKFLLVCTLSALTLTAIASPNAPQKNVDYMVLKTPQPTEKSNKVEVVEFFGYFCPHCYALDSTLINWARKNKDKVDFRRVNVSFAESMALHQKLFYSLVAMDELTNPLHHKIFDAIQVQRTRLSSDEDIFNFVEKQGVNRSQFEQMFRSFYVDLLCKTAVEYQTLYEIEAVPMIIIDGRYQTSPAIVSSGNNMDLTEKEMHKETLKVMDYLVRRSLKERANKKHNK